jgi:hypothetical protein
MRKFALVLFLSVIPLLFANSAGHADLRWEQHAGTCLIRITGKEFESWVKGQLSGQSACVTIGQQVDYENPPYPLRDVCVCVGASHGRQPTVGFALCADRGNRSGPRDSRVAQWCDRVAVPNIAGSWTCRGPDCCRDGGRATIVQTGNNLVVTNECTPPLTVTGTISGDTIRVGWPPTGTLSPDQRTITWSNRSRWVR